MKSPLDWDYADLRKRMEAINRPAFVARSGKPGDHCDWCPAGAEDVPCPLGCIKEYIKRYGVDPS